MAIFNNVYATQQDYSDYTGIELGSLPSDIDLRLKKASRLITMVISGYNENNENHQEGTRLATCAQVEYWYNAVDNTLTPNDFTELELGNLRIKKGNSLDSVNKSRYLNDFARNFLYKTGLLYRGVSFGRTNANYNNTINVIDSL